MSNFCFYNSYETNFSFLNFKFIALNDWKILLLWWNLLFSKNSNATYHITYINSNIIFQLSYIILYSIITLYHIQLSYYIILNYHIFIFQLSCINYFLLFILILKIYNQNYSPIKLILSYQGIPYESFK